MEAVSWQDKPFAMRALNDSTNQQPDPQQMINWQYIIPYSGQQKPKGYEELAARSLSTKFENYKFSMHTLRSSMQTK